MNEEWKRVKEDLEAQGLRYLASEIPEDVATAALQKGDGHPLGELLRAPRRSPMPSPAKLTDSALKRIGEWLSTPSGRAERGWWSNRIRKLASKAEEASGALAEIRAFGCLLPRAHSSFDSLQVRPNHGARKATDFAVGRDQLAFVEVCCVRANLDELDRHIELDAIEDALISRALDVASEQLALHPDEPFSVRSSTQWVAARGIEAGKIRRHQVTHASSPLPDGSTAGITLSVRESKPAGPQKPEGAVHTVASRLAGKKASGQVPRENAGVLWMDLADFGWPITVAGAQPVELFSKGHTLANTPGVWHAFYGRQGVTPMFERAVVGLELGAARQCTTQVFDGRFREDNGHSWSAAVLRCTDGLVVLENPDALVELPFEILRGLVALPGYAQASSFHRFAADERAGLRRRLEDVEARLRFYAA
jgi:hypothetical protein